MLKLIDELILRRRTGLCRNGKDVFGQSPHFGQVARSIQLLGPRFLRLLGIEGALPNSRVYGPHM
jgi:hypothetical protein